MNGVRAMPQVFVEVDGSRLEAGSAAALGEIRVQQRLSMPTLCELTFFDLEASTLALVPPAVGARLRVVARGESEPLFEGEVTAVEYVYEPFHGKEIRVRGYDSLHLLRKRQPVRAHVQVTPADLARELVADLGISVVAPEPGPLCQRWVQYRQSDFDLLVEVAERCGLYLTLRGDVLYLTTLAGFGERIPLTLGESLLEARVEVNADAACRSVDAIGWDPLRIEKHRGRAEKARMGHETGAEVEPRPFGDSGERTLVDETLQDDLQAEALAQAELDRRVGQEIFAWGIAQGDARLKPGTPVEVKGVAAPFGGRYVLTSVDHTIDREKAFLSEFSSFPPVAQVRVRATTAALGQVTRVDDPDGFGRVQVSLPTYGDVETDWLGVVTAGAGAKKGLISLPDVGDQVLVLFARGDPAQGVVLGGLYGAQAPPDSGVEARSVRRFTFLTPGGQRLQLDDVHNTIRLENNEGSHVELTPEKILMHAEGDIEIEAPGRSIVIRAKAIDFERA